MVTAAPNRTELTATVQGLRRHDQVGKWDVLTLVVRSSDAVPGYRDMLHAKAGDRLEVLVDRDWLPPGELIGRTVRLAVEMAGPDVVRVVRADPSITVVA